jgi:hypothetical protein
MTDEPAATPTEPPADETPAEPTPSKMGRAIAATATVLRHKQLLVAAMEMLRAKAALSEEEEVKIISAYENGTETVRTALADLVERLQKANFGKVMVSLAATLQPVAANIKAEDLTVPGLRAKAAPALHAIKEEVLAEARPYVERAKQRLAELRVLEEPTLQRLEAISGNLRGASKEIAGSLKGVGREAADEFVRRGKRWWMSAETEELEREFFDWALKSLPKAERATVHLLMGFGIVLFMSGILLAAQEVGILRELAIFLAIFLMLGLGLAMINWGIKLSEAMKSGRGEIERLARMTPQERRVHLTQRWAQRAQAEGLITSNEAQTVLEQTINALPAENGAKTERPQKPPLSVELPKGP